MAKQFQPDRKTWFASQRQSLGPDWTARINPENLNKDIERVIRDLYHGNIGETDINSNPDFRDLCSYSIVTAMRNYYMVKLSNFAPIFLSMEQTRQLRLDGVNNLSEEFREAEIAKINEELKNIPAWHFVYECYEYYYNAFTTLENFINSGFTEISFMDNFCRIVFKMNNKWGNPSVRFI